MRQRAALYGFVVMSVLIAGCTATTVRSSAVDGSAAPAVTSAPAGASNASATPVQSSGSGSGPSTTTSITSMSPVPASSPPLSALAPAVPTVESSASAITTAVSGAPAAVGGGEGWLLLNYQPASNTLEEPEVHDLNEALAVSDPTVTVLSLIDRGTDTGAGRGDIPTAPGIPKDPHGGTQIVELHQGQATLLGTTPNEDMTDPDTMAAFIAAGIARYPNRKVAFNIDDHGGGWNGVGEDDGTAGDPFMGLPAVVKGISAGLAKAGRAKFDILGFDACMMAELDVARAMAPFSDRMIASPEEEPGDGWDWTYTGALTASTTPDQFAHLAIKFFKDFYSKGPLTPSTLALIDESKIGEVEKAVTTLSTSELTDGDDAAPEIARARAQSLQYGPLSDPTAQFRLVDLGDLADHLEKQGGAIGQQAGPAVKKALDDVVMEGWASPLRQASSGLSVYLPATTQTTSPQYDDVGGSTLWNVFLNDFHARVAKLPKVDPFDPAVSPQVEFDSGNFAATGGYLMDQQANVVDAKCSVGLITAAGNIEDLLEVPATLDEHGGLSGTGVAGYLGVTDGTHTTPIFSRAGNSYFVPFDYTDSGGRSAVVTVFLNIASTGVTADQAFVVLQDGTSTRTVLDPKGTLKPRFEEIGSDGTATWKASTGASVTADLSQLKFGLVQFPSGTKIGVGFTLTTDAGQDYTVNTTVTVP